MIRETNTQSKSTLLLEHFWPRHPHKPCRFLDCSQLSPNLRSIRLSSDAFNCSCIMSSSARSYRHTHTHPHTHTDTEYFPQLYSEADRIENLFNYPLKRFYQSHPQAAVFGSDFDSSLSSCSPIIQYTVFKNWPISTLQLLHQLQTDSINYFTIVTENSLCKILNKSTTSLQPWYYAT